jgi:2-polyprenyl-6-methoxyphenol hydroxylase-like FAD-dependent oxidoreductase
MRTTKSLSSPNTGRLAAKAGQHAVVIGGSMAGLLAGRILADHFAQVTIIERDRFPQDPVPRPGVPQARHLHALLMRGREVLEQLFPGLSKELTAAGAIVIEAGADLAWLTPGGWGVNFQSGLTALAFTRALLDWRVRHRLAEYNNVRFLEDYEVTGLIANSSHQAVTGITLRLRQGTEPNSEQRLEADLVVDASGRNSRLPQWLTALGYPSPAETVINAHLGYASRLYRPPAGFEADWKGIFLQAAPPDNTRAGVLFPVEGGRWLVTLGGGDRDYPPTDEAGFLNFAHSLPSPLLYNAIKDAEPLSPIYGHRGTENRRRHYERLARWPERLVVTGDGACAFNPVYGQGMTTAALGALALDECLREQRRHQPGGDLIGLARHFQRRLAKVNAAPWMLATGEDYRYRGTTGGRPDRVTRLLHRYMDHIFRLSTESVYVRRRFLEVHQMLRPPAALFRPGVILRVLWQALRQVFVSQQTAAEAVPKRRLPEMT